MSEDELGEIDDMKTKPSVLVKELLLLAFLSLVFGAALLAVFVVLFELLFVYSADLRPP